MDHVLYAELTPQMFRERLAAAPIAYLPLGTLEWHGEHLPLGSDGMQSQGFFEILAREVGGIVLPMLFLGPDRREEIDGQELYGMDICKSNNPAQGYPTQKLDGSAYWVDEALYVQILDATLAQLARAGFRIVVGHGHGPSTHTFQAQIERWKAELGLSCLTCWGSPYDKEGLGIQVDHAAMNETSLMMALHPDLVQMDRLPADLDQWPVAVGGQDPRIFASPEVGRRALSLQRERMTTMLGELLEQL